MTISSVAPTGSTSGTSTLTDTGIGSGLDVNGIVSKLMQVESQPLTQLNNQIASYQATLSAYGTVNSAISTFQSAVQSLNTAAASTSLAVNPVNSSILTGTAGTTAVAGSYNVNVTQLAQAQSLTTNGEASSTTAIGTGASTTISFVFGTIGSSVAGKTLGSSVATGGIAAGSLSINGTTISTGTSTTSAKLLAAQINLATATTGVTATAQASTTGTLAFSPVSTGSGDAYTLSVGGVTIASVGANASLSAADLDTALQSTGAGSVGAQLAAAGISVTGTAVDGTLQFSKADGSNLTLSQALTNSSGNASGGLSGIDSSGATETYLGGVNLSASTPITIAGNTPASAGLTAGSSLSSGVYSNSTFTQNTSLAGGSVVIDSSNSSLQGIAAAVNNANIGVTASIINDGSSTPYRLVFTSTTTGAAASMKISVNGDSTLSNLLSEDPAGTQNLTQSVNAQNTNLTVNGIAITSANNTVSGAIQGVTLNVAQIGSTSVSVAQNSSSIQSAVSAFVSAYNTLNSTFSAATAYNATTQTAGPLIGDSGLQTIQFGIRQLLGAPVAGVSQNLNSLAQLGITFKSDGSMALNTSTLQSAISSNYSGVGAVFSAIGNSTDNLIGYKSATSATKAGTYAVNISQLATQGSEVGSAAPGLTITSGSNDTLDLTIDGVTASVTIPAGTYTAATLAAQIQTTINGSSAISNAGSAVNVAVNGSGALSITSQRYGSASLVNLGGDAVSSLLGTTPTLTKGLDVEGSIGGNPASGSGQVLTGLAGSATAGLALTVNGGAVGDRGTITYSQGYANQLNTLLTSYLGSSGPLINESNALKNSITSINTQISAMNITLAAQQANYLAEFQALDTTISSLDATQTFLTQQLASLASTSSGG